MQGDSTYSPLGTQTLPGAAKPTHNLVADFSDKLSVKGGQPLASFYLPLNRVQPKLVDQSVTARIHTVTLMIIASY